MANQSLPTPQIVLDANGLPVPGAQVFYYQSGTLTLISVYADQAGATLTTNPVIADGSGALPQTFVTVTAKAIIKDADGATLYTLDPVPVIQSVGSGASQISFNPTVEIAATDAQAAIELVDANWRAAATGYQPSDADLSALAAMSGTGIAVRTAANTWANRSITASNGIAITDGGGVAANPAIALTRTETAVITLAGTSTDISTALPAGVKRITVYVTGYSGSSTGDGLLQIGTGGAYVTTGYVSASSHEGSSVNSTAGFIDKGTNGSAANSGSLIITMRRVNASTNTWQVAHSGTVGALGYAGGGTISLAGAIDRIRYGLTTGSFDAGAVMAEWDIA